ncbi:MAG: hypothetical protein ACYC3X_11505 [Pirellulaceae bacterium]
MPSHRTPQAPLEEKVAADRSYAGWLASAQDVLAWLLATCPDGNVRNPSEAVALATQAVEAAPAVGQFWNTLGIAQYRVNQWDASGEQCLKVVHRGDEVTLDRWPGHEHARHDGIALACGTFDLNELISIVNLPLQSTLALLFSSILPVAACADFHPAVARMALDRDRVQPGGTVQATYTFLSSGRASEELEVFVHVVHPDGRHIGADFEPDLMTSAWPSDGCVREGPFPIVVPDDAGPGKYQIWVGMFFPSSGDRIEFGNADRLRGHHEYHVGEFEVVYQMQVPECLMARGRADRGGDGDFRFGSSMHGEEIWQRDKEQMPDFLGMFCRTILPWYYLSRFERMKLENGELYYSDGVVARTEGGKRFTRRGDFVMREDDHLFVPALWNQQEIIAYSRAGYENRSWRLPDDWNGVRNVDLYRITLNGCVPLKENLPITDRNLVLSLGKAEALSIVPAGTLLSGRAPR